MYRAVRGRVSSQMRIPFGPRLVGLFHHPTKKRQTGANLEPWFFVQAEGSATLAGALSCIAQDRSLKCAFGDSCETAVFCRWGPCCR